MGLNSIRNPAKLRKISALIGEPCEYAASRYFADQKELIAFGSSGGAWCVNMHTRTAEPYTEEGRLLLPYRKEPGGAPSGVRSEPTIAAKGR